MREHIAPELLLMAIFTNYISSVRSRNFWSSGKK